MSKFLALFGVLCAINAVLCARGHGGGRNGGHGGKGGKSGKGGMGEEADALMCNSNNMKDDKFDQFRAEIEKCHLDECAQEADDIGTIEKWENKIVARMHCSQKYKTCHKNAIDKHKKSRQNTEGSGPNEQHKNEWKQMMDKHQACIKDAFERVFGKISDSP